MHELFSCSPSISVEALPVEQQPYGDVIWLQLNHLAAAAYDFEAALSLYDVSIQEISRYMQESRDAIRNATVMPKDLERQFSRWANRRLV